MNNKVIRSAVIYISIFLVILLLVTLVDANPSSIVETDMQSMIEEFGNDNISSISIQGNVVTLELKDNTTTETFFSDSLEPFVGSMIWNHINENPDVISKDEPPESASILLELLPTIIMVLLIVVFWFFFMQNSQGGGSKVMSFGKSKAKMVKNDESKITFDDVAGLKEEKEEMIEIVDFLKNPKKYTDLGARIPKGLLMVGPPGTGKTYLSKACAGEAGVPFYTISGSDFVEMFVGVGASRVRDLFEEAKKNAPCVVFIDEIDAVGRKRGAGLGGGNDEREQTLNQLLVEMDGFGDNAGIIIIAATNRPDILDPALLRPGRFDRQVMVGIPDVREREAIIKVHARNKPMAEDVEYQVLAKSTPGFTPADLENVMNEAALLSARVDDKTIKMDTVKKAIIKVVVGVEKNSRIVNEKERKLTAYHEAGHAILAYVLPDTDPVHQVTIIPRGRTGGFTMQLPGEESSYHTKKSMERELVTLLGGRIAEKLILDDISTGAQNDLGRVTKIAKDMVTKYAMSDNLASMSYDSDEEVFMGRDFGAAKNYSEEVSAEIDKEVRKIVDNAYANALQLLEDNTDKLHLVAEALLKYETISGEEFKLVIEEGMEALSEKVEAEKAKLKEEKRIIKEREERELEALNRMNEASEEGHSFDKIVDDELENSKEDLEVKSEEKESDDRA